MRATIPAPERLEILWTLAWAAGLLFLLRFVSIQVLQHAHYRELAEKNRTQVIAQSAPRGRIISSDGELIASSKPSFSLVYFPGASVPPSYAERLAAALAGPLGMKEEVLKSSLRRAVTRETPARIAENLSVSAMFAISELKNIYSGIDVITEARRHYPFGSYLSHLVGYMGKMDAREWARYGALGGYGFDSKVGKTGLEKMYEKELRGKSGGIFMEVDSRGRLSRILESRKWVPGADIRLTVDSVVQSAAEEGLRKSLSGRGAVVALDPRNGAILAFASAPGYDPNSFVSYSDEEFPRQAEKIPEFNMAVQGTYPPASIFKIISAAAFLESGRIDPSEKVFCPGYYDAGSRVFKCWEKKGHGRMDFLDGLANSCDVYYYVSGLRAGPLSIEKQARAFGVGRPTGIRLSDERAGNLFGPTRRATRKSYWFVGDTLNLVIGQGETLATPAQMAVMIAAVASRGSLWKPFYVDRVVSPEGKTILSRSPEKTGEVRLRPETWDLIWRALKKTVDEGTGRPAIIKGVEVYGKTGTAQNPHGEDHAWFASFARIGDGEPRVAVAVLVEHGKSGSGSAGPIAKRVMEAALRDVLTPPPPPPAPAVEVSTIPAAAEIRASSGTVRPRVRVSTSPAAMPPVPPENPAPAADEEGDEGRGD
ncbi:MAG: penicillin-binding protein 2 [Elusimicrobia bacterium]|nr:MAG: penicillin-binding protein 2 [Elusimicrobiota bacterium]KAF0157523.1 MAG: penicillin-binding protein 2 [Elusimicrobiota bacterium]